MIFSEKVKYVRTKLLLSQKELAKQLGVAFATVNRWENQGIQPQFLTEVKFDQFCKQHNIKFDE